MDPHKLVIVDYTKTSYVVFGPTKFWNQELRSLGGKYSSKLKNGSGYTFNKSNSDLSHIESFIRLANNGIIRPSTNNAELQTNLQQIVASQQPVTREFFAPRSSFVYPIVDNYLQPNNNIHNNSSLKYQTVQYKIPKPIEDRNIIVKFQRGDTYQFTITGTYKEDDFISRFKA